MILSYIGRQSFVLCKFHYGLVAIMESYIEIDIIGLLDLVREFRRCACDLLRNHSVALASEFNHFSAIVKRGSDVCHT